MAQGLLALTGFVGRFDGKKVHRTFFKIRLTPSSASIVGSVVVFMKIVETRSDIFYLRHAISKLSGSNLIIKKPAVDLVKQHTYAVPYEG